MSLDTTPLASIEMQLQHAQWLRGYMVAELRVQYRWLWFQRVLGAVCIALGIRAALALGDPSLDQWHWWLNLLGAVLNLVGIPINIWSIERRWLKQLREAAMLPGAIAAMKRARSIALRCPHLGPTDEPCTYCQGCECPFKTAEEQLARLRTTMGDGAEQYPAEHPASPP